MWCLPTITDRWQAVQPGPSPGKVLMLWSVCAGTPLCWWSALVAQSLEDLQAMLDRFVAASVAFGLTINISKTEVLYQPALALHHKDPDLYIHGRTNQICPKLHLLRCVISSENSIDLEITRRIRVLQCVWSSRCSSVVPARSKLATKCKLYRVFVLPCLLYSTETYTLYRRHLKKLTSIQLRHLRSIMGLTWRDRVCNGEVLQKASMESVEAMLVKSQLRWAGHVVRMPDDRLPKAVFYSELTSGKRKRGGQKLRYKDVLKRHGCRHVGEWCQKSTFLEEKDPCAGNTIERKRKEKYLEGWRKRHPSNPT